jgi:serine/threonine protein kinase
MQRNIFSNEEDVVIKLGSDGDLLMTDYNVAKRLHECEVPGIMKYNCYFTCDDNQHNYQAGYVGPLCHGPGECMRAIVMPYMPLGSLKAYKNWDGTLQVKSCLKQSLSAIVQAYDRCAIVLTDRHTDNILLQHTNKSSITFHIEGQALQLDTHGLLALHMDFENSLDCACLPEDTRAAVRAHMMRDLETLVTRFQVESKSYTFMTMTECPLHRLQDPSNSMPLFHVLKDLCDWVDNVPLKEALDADALLSWSCQSLTEVYAPDGTARSV